MPAAAAIAHAVAAGRSVGALTAPAPGRYTARATVVGIGRPAGGGLMHAFVDWLVGTIGAMGYPGIFLLMAMESSIIPVPSELVMPPAGYLAQQGQMNVYLAIFWGTVGSLAGAYANYYAAHYLGRPLVLRYGRYVG